MITCMLACARLAVIFCSQAKAGWRETREMAAEGSNGECPGFPGKSQDAGNF